MNTPQIDDRGLPLGYSLNPEWELSPRDTEALRREGTVLVIDVRLTPEWDLTHLAGSIHIPLDEIASRADSIEVPPGKTVALMCHRGVRSLKAAALLREAGIHAFSIAGGMESWSLAIDPATPRYGRDGARVWKL
jgi:rhodanese-related sulfurtransferase